MSSAAVIAVAVSLGSVLALLLLGKPSYPGPLTASLAYRPVLPALWAGHYCSGLTPDLALAGILAYVVYRWRAAHQPKTNIKPPKDVEAASSSIKPAISASHHAFPVPAGVPASAGTHSSLNDPAVLQAGTWLCCIELAMIC